MMNGGRDAPKAPGTPGSGPILRVGAPLADLPDTVRQLVGQDHPPFIGLVVEHTSEPPRHHLHYVWMRPAARWLVVDVSVDGAAVPSITPIVFAADWAEREAEDLFGVTFAGHPQLGDFVLHDEDWAESVAPMRRRPERPTHGGGRDPYEPPRIVKAPGQFVMPVGPVFAGAQESVRFLLETVGEEIMHAHVRLFYKYRGLEKLMEGQLATRALLVAERVSGTQALAHGLAFAQAVEALASVVAPTRARAIRTVLAEWERLRSHVGTLAGIVESTGLSVPANLLAAVEERLLQLSGRYLGHRYLFGLVALGGLTRDPGDDALHALARAGAQAVASVQDICRRLPLDNSFLDRLEAVGILAPERAATLGVVGPVGRASQIRADVRLWHPYAAYREHPAAPVLESEGDGYARFRVFLREAAAAMDLIQRLVGTLPPGPIHAFVPVVPGVGLSAVEAPSGALAYWVRVGSRGVIDRCHIMTPAFLNWHGLPDTVRDFAFQDFPIIASTFGLSVADADR